MELSKAFTDRFSSLLHDGEQWSDLEIDFYYGVKFNVHRVVVCSQSKVLDQMVRETLRQNPNSVGKAHIHLDGEIEEVWEEVLRYLYTGDYLSAQQKRVSPEDHAALTGDHVLSATSSPTEASLVVSHCDMYRVSHQYGIDHLKELSRSRLLKWMSANQFSSECSDVIEDLLSWDLEDTYMEQVLAKDFWEKIVSFLGYLDIDYGFMNSVGFLRKVLVEVTSDKGRLEKELREANEKIRILESIHRPEI